MISVSGSRGISINTSSQTRVRVEKIICIFVTSASVTSEPPGHSASILHSNLS